MYFDPRIIDDIRNRVSIIDIVSSYVRLKKGGRNYLGLCPFHMEKTPSFTVSAEKQIYHCFGCGVGGNVFNFIMEMEKVSFPESVRILAKKAGVTLPESNKADFQKKVKLKEEIFKINKRAAFIYNYFLLKKPEGESARQYLKKRNIDEKTISDFNLGFAPDDWSRLHRNLKKEGYSDNIQMQAGLTIARSNNTGFYDRFRNRIIFSIFNDKEEVFGFGGRVLDDSLPKYINSPENAVFQKGKNLYGINLAKSAFREEKKAIIVEGYFDVIALYKKGIKYAVAPLGTSLTENQVLLLSRYVENLYFIFDSDKAGQLAVIRGLNIVIRSGINANIVILPEGKDPFDYMENHTKEDMIELLNKADDLFSYLFKIANKNFDISNVKGKVEAANLIFPFIVKIESEIEKEERLKQVAGVLKINFEAIRKEYERFKVKGFLNVPKADKVSPSEKEIVSNTQRELVLLLCGNSDIYQDVKSFLRRDEFSDKFAINIISIFESIDEKGLKITVDSVLNLVDNDVDRRYIAQKLMDESYNYNAKMQINDLIRRLKIDNIEHRIKLKNEKIKEAEANNDEGLLRKLLEELQSYYNERERYLKVSFFK